MEKKNDSYLRIRINSEDKRVLKEMLEKQGTNLTAFLKDIVNSKVNTTFA